MRLTCQLLFKSSLLCLLLAILIIQSHQASAQQNKKTFSGIIKNNKGEPVQGVSVVVKGTSKGVITDINGAFKIEAEENSVLVLTSVGYEPQEIKVSGDQLISVQLIESAAKLNEIIVVGYSTQKKASVTGAISSITSEDLVKTPATTISAALVGKVQGITSRSPDSRPGRGTNIQVRNLGNPLFVVDGVPYTGGSTATTAFGFTQGSGQDIFNTLGLEDIESITILKDASASIYGLRAANGVVLITTKKGKRETPSINVSGYYGLQNFTRYPHPANAGQYVRALVEAEQNANRNPALLYTKEELAKWEDGTYKSYDYYDIVTRPNVPQKYIHADASGGSQRSNYFFGVSHLDQDAIIRDYSYKRTNIEANLNTNLANRLQVGTQISLRLEKTHNVGVPGLDDYFNPFLSISSMWPIESPYANDNPKYIQETHSVNLNPATYKDDVTGWIEEVWHAMNINLNAQYDFRFGLVAKGTLSYNYQNEDFDGMEFTYPAYKYNPTTDKYEDRSPTGALYGNQNPWRERHKRNVISRYAQFQLSYNKQIGPHSISAVAGYERSDYDNSYFVVHSVPTNNYVSLQSFSEQDFLQDSWSVEARAGYIGRVNYNYQQRYLLELLGRYDGSYLYAPDNRWGFFPGVSIGWRLTNEPFFEKFVGKYLNDLKLRASYGEVGSESGINAFDYLPGYNFNSGSAILDGAYVIGLRPRGLPITNLSWVVNRTKNIGIDFTLLHNKLTGQFDVFERKRTGLPASKYDVLLPSEVGYTLPNENLNSDAHRGIEGILTYTDKAGKISYSVGINGTLSRLRNISTYKPRFGNSWDKYRNSIEDRWSGITFGYHVIGRFQSYDDINSYPINNDGQGNRTELPGDFKYEDANGDMIINTLDQRPIGYAQGAQPYMSFGINGRVGYKGITLSFDFAGATMQSFRRQFELLFPFQNSGNSPAYMFTDRWHRTDPYDPNSEWIPGTYPATRKDNTAHINYQLNDFWLTNVSYLRLRNLELGYDLPKKILKLLGGISRLRIYANGTNLFSLDNVKDIETDPEISSTNGLVYPQQRLYNFGFNLTF